MLVIHSNGSKWAGEQPDTIETLLDVLSKHPLDPTFEDYGNFISHEDGVTTFFGNFYDVSHVFQIDTDEPEVIAKLTRAIRANQGNEFYKQGKKRA